MPSPRAALRNRRGWTQAHFIQLACGHDYTRGAWGILSRLDDAALVAAIEEMQTCWRQHWQEITDDPPLNPRPAPWFAAYARDPQRLLDECHKARAYMEYQHAHGGYRPYEEFEQQYTPPRPASPAVATV